MSETIPATPWPNVEGMNDLMEIALNLHSCWNHEADEMWRSLDPDLWEWTQNPWVILLTASRDKIIALLASPGFRALVLDCLHHKRKSFNEKAWFQEKYHGKNQGAALSLVAYFSMEFMLSEALPIYSGGLGNVAGDQLKAASDLGVPVAGIGLLYGQGYFRQDFDDVEAEAMYSLLEKEVVPEFYERSENGMPSKWLSRVRESMARLTPEFSASRAIQNYTEEHYLPAASGYRQRAANNSALGTEVLQWLHKIAQGWNTVHFGPMHAETREGKHFFRVQVWPGDLSSCDLNVELYADAHGERGAEIVTMTAGDKSTDAKGSVIYSVDISATRAASDYTPRLVPHHPSVAVPLEAGEILWER
jgi:glucan phosphorylase